MKRIELRLVPAPGAKPEFLATMEPKSKSPPPAPWASLPDVLVLEAYTRDVWAADTSTKDWSSFQVLDLSGRQKLPGFVKYLRERQKSAYGTYRHAASGAKYAWVVPYQQMSSQTLACRVAPVASIPGCPFRDMPPAAAAQPSGALEPSGSALPKRKTGGLLGNLVGAQRRTNQHLQTANMKKAPAPTPVANSTSAVVAAIPPEELKTSAEVLAEFRHEMEQKMLDFDMAPDPVLKIRIDLNAKLRTMSDEEKQQNRVTLEILKYIVYEQAEEVNEEWIAHKEPSEFLDDVTIAIYKEGEAPPEVLEEINKAELPDEVRGQQQAIQEQLQRAKVQKDARQKAALQQAALRNATQDEEAFAALNTQKRDRRTIEEMQREMYGDDDDPKRARLE